MNRNKTKAHYDQAIGEFVVLYAQLDLHISKFIAVHCKLASENGFTLTIPIQTKLDDYGKVKKLDNIISNNLNSGNIQLIREYWSSIKQDIFDLTDIRHH